MEGVRGCLYPLIYKYCVRRGVQDSDAQDITQDVLAGVCRSIRDFEYDPIRGRFRSWLGTVTFHALLKHQRKSQRAVRGMGDGKGDAIMDAIPSAVESEWTEEFNTHLYRMAVERVRPEFDEETWQVFELVWVGDRHPRDVAQDLGRDRRWVYQAKYKVMRRLRAELEFLAADMPLSNRK